jgi:hypothetical protein
VETVRTGETAERPARTPRGTFVPGNSGRPKGIPDKRTIGGRQAAQALASQAWEVVRSLLSADSPLDARIRLDAAKVVLEYAHGKPIQRLEVNLEDEARTWAERAGVTPAELLAQASAMVDEAMN